MRQSAFDNHKMVSVKAVAPTGVRVLTHRESMGCDHQININVRFPCVWVGNFSISPALNYGIDNGCVQPKQH